MGHINASDHGASIDNFCLLENVSNVLYLRIHESLLILSNRPTLNL